MTLLQVTLSIMGAGAIAGGVDAAAVFLCGTDYPKDVKFLFVGIVFVFIVCFLYYWHKMVEDTAHIICPLEQALFFDKRKPTQLARAGNSAKNWYHGWDKDQTYAPHRAKHTTLATAMLVDKCRTSLYSRWQLDGVVRRSFDSEHISKLILEYFGVRVDLRCANKPVDIKSVWVEPQEVAVVCGALLQQWHILQQTHVPWYRCQSSAKWSFRTKSNIITFTLEVDMDAGQETLNLDIKFGGKLPPRRHLVQELDCLSWWIEDAEHAAGQHEFNGVCAYVCARDSVVD